MAGLPQLASFCAGTAAEAPEACVGALLACLAGWGLEAIIANSPFNQRVAWFQGFIGNASTNSPNLNTLAIATYYNNPFEHGSGVGKVIGDCGHTHHEIPMRGDWGTTQGVEIYTVGDGSNCCVEHWGDGGWTNWGYYGEWQRSKTATGSDMLCIKAPPPPQHPNPEGIQRYTINANLVTVNGVVGRLLEESVPLYSFNTNNALYKYSNFDSGPYWEAIVQKDGNFVVYSVTPPHDPVPKFWTNTGGKTNDPNWELIPQHDGNLVLYRSNTGGQLAQPVWASGTSGINVGNGWVGLSMQQDGNLVLYVFYPDGSCSPVWASAGSPPQGKKYWPGLSGMDGMNGTFVVQGGEEL
ncbi:MAG: hypothetical protein M1829_002446 [Trizodia sp. TS-e1964]|nr:MAG: hypothetical protein M1829_002446 [Trizodia sp. TS-e1964]